MQDFIYHLVFFGCKKKIEFGRVRVEFEPYIKFADNCCGFGFGWKNLNPTGAGVGFVLSPEQLLGLGSGAGFR